MAYDIASAFEDIEMSLIKSMRNNMKRHINEEYDEGINWTQWQAEMLAGLSQYRAENQDVLKDYMGRINAELDAAIREAYATGESEQEIELLKAIKQGYNAPKDGSKVKMQGSFFRSNQKKLNALVKSTTDDMKKAETALLRMTDDVYRKTLFKAQMFYNTGAGSMWQCVDMATKDFRAAGINCVQYKNGARVNIASYAEMALRTANKRANLMGQAQTREKWGIHTVKVNYRGIACPICLQYLGQVYIDDVYGGGTYEESVQTGYPLLSTAVAGGLFHPNCKDACSTYYEGINRPPERPTPEQEEEIKRKYNLEQEQRYYERNYKKNMRMGNGCLDQQEAGKYFARASQYKKKLIELCENNPDVLRLDKARLSLRGVLSVDNVGRLSITPQAIKSVSDASNFKDLQSYFKKKGFKMNDAIEKLDFNSVKDTTKGVDIVLNEFPQAKKIFAGFDIGKSGVACASFTGKISFNPAYYTDAKNLQCMIMGNTTGFHPKNTGIVEIGSHEMGHILELALINKHNGGVLAWSECTEAKKIVSEACKLAKKLPEGKGKVNATLKREISGYAMQNASECMAEGVADYIANKNNASVLSRMIWNLLKGELG